jgi:cytochrome b pre-mRNA-processing protein 3
VFGFFRRSPNQPLIDRLYGEIMAAARQPAFFTDYGVADTVAGRFEIMCLVAALATQRLNALPAPGPELAQETTDAIFRYLDVALREMGVGDLSVPKKMKKMAQGFLGRGLAYRKALEQPDDAGLALALARNVHGDEARAPEERTLRLARFARAYEAALQGLDLETALTGKLPQVDAGAIA